jgi:hypothetical protein
MHEISEKRERLCEYHLSYRNTYSRTSPVNVSVNCTAIPYCPPDKSVSGTQMSAARRDLDRSAASARRLFDGDDAILHNTVRTPSRRGRRSLLVAAARFLCSRTLPRAEFFVPKESSYQLG